MMHLLLSDISCLPANVFVDKILNFDISCFWCLSTRIPGVAYLVCCFLHVFTCRNQQDRKVNTFDRGFIGNWKEFFKPIPPSRINFRAFIDDVKNVKGPRLVEVVGTS